MNKTIGILGGMGPMATCDLMKKIIEQTDASCDQEHIRICVDSNTNIPDRTKAILYGGENPVPEMVKSALYLQSMGADVIIMPCNTAHFFLEDVQKFVNVPILNMPMETAIACKKKGVKSAAILATEGTINSGIYHKALKSQEICPVIPNAEEQKIITSIIYDFVKAGKPHPYERKLAQMISRFTSLGVEALILGCTELPIAFSQTETAIALIDPTLILAAAAIQFVKNETKLAQ
ncbi:MAG: amino acid racemase [Clostridia bacterium]|nr:amino acid racemase [Clostridia bacterium]